MDNNKHFAPAAKENRKEGQILVSPALNGLGQMACDVLMLEKIQKELQLEMAIRFYKWEGAWLSIGHNQKKLPRNWIDLAKKKKLRLVRRPSGGSAVLHAGGLTYSLAWHSPPKKKHLAYFEASKWLINCFAGLGVKLRVGNQVSTFQSDNCFDTSTVADLVDEEGIKRVGSAQLWRKGNLLQHGEILLDPPAKLWVEVFKRNPPKEATMAVPRDGLEEVLIRQLFLQWPQLNWNTKEFSTNELQKILDSSKSYLVNPSNSDF